MVLPMPMWSSLLKTEIENSFSNQSKGDQAIIDAWQNWIEKVASDIKVSPPYLSQGTIDKTKFAPLKFPKKGNPITAALIYSNAWFSWYMSIQWAPHAGPPIPPFTLQVLKISPSPSGASAAKTKLLENLKKEFKSKDKSAMSKKYENMAKYFYEATLSAGVQIDGLATGSPPPPVQIPKFQIL